MLELFIINMVALVLWKLFRKHIEGTAAELLLTCVLLGAAAATVIPALIGAELKDQQAALETQVEEAATNGQP